MENESKNKRQYRYSDHIMWTENYEYNKWLFVSKLSLKSSETGLQTETPWGQIQLIV